MEGRRQSQGAGQENTELQSPLKIRYHGGPGTTQTEGTARAVSASTPGCLMLCRAGVHAHTIYSLLLSRLSLFLSLYVKNIIRLLIPSVGKNVETRDPHSSLLRRCIATPLWKAISQSPVKLKALTYRPGTNPTHATRVCKERVKEPPLLQPCLEHQKNGEPPELSTTEQWNTLHQQKQT